MDNILDAEMSWKDFLSSTVNGTAEDRYVRINPNIGTKPPELDAIDQLESLQDVTRRALKKEKWPIQDIARSLISSSFYFDMISPPSPEGAAGFKCKGKKLMKPSRMLILYSNLADLAKVKFSVGLRAIYVSLAITSCFSRDPCFSPILRYLRTRVTLPSNR